MLRAIYDIFAQLLALLLFAPADPPGRPRDF